MPLVIVPSVKICLKANTVATHCIRVSRMLGQNVDEEDWCKEKQLVEGYGASEKEGDVGMLLKG